MIEKLKFKPTPRNFIILTANIIWVFFAYILPIYYMSEAITHYDEAWDESKTGLHPSTLLLILPFAWVFVILLIKDYYARFVRFMLDRYLPKKDVGDNKNTS